MFKKKNHIFLVFILFAISVSLISVFIIQYGLGYQPCKLCVYQRIPYIISIFLILEIIILKKNHFGIEQGFFDGSSVCESKNSFESLSKEQLLEQLKQNTISCKDVSFTILGLSLATINSIFSIMLSVIFIKLYINYEKN